MPTSAAKQPAETTVNGKETNGSDSLQLCVERHFEEALELWLFHVKGEDRTALRVSSCTVELVIDKSPAGKGPDEPPKDAFVKRLDVGGLKQPVMIQNMPSGLSFYITVVATLPNGRHTRSKWERTRTLPLSEAGRENTDLLGNTRGRCRNCPCKCFRQLAMEVPHVNDMAAVSICRRCGCNSLVHEEVMASAADRIRPGWSNMSARVNISMDAARPFLGQKLEEEQERAAGGKDRAKASRDAGQPPAPPAENERWTNRERCLYELSSKQFHPDVMAAKRRALCSVGGKGRVSVCCPTVESRQLFHEQLWNVFHASDWPDKELIVVETYQGSPSAFFQSKAEEDQRVIYVAFQRPRFDDWSIGLKRNMATHLATGEFVANFDDDDLYAPNYLSTMIEAMHKQRSFGVTLSSWYVYDVGCQKVGFVDPQAMCEDPREKENWLYGYGFSYVYTRKVALTHPYPDQNMREDYDFFTMIRNSEHLQVYQDPLQSMTIGGPRIALHYDDYGICVHTLHPRSTSHSWAKREVPMDEVLGLDIAEMAPVLESYFTRFPRTTESSPYIGKFERRADRPLEISIERRRFAIPCPAGATAQQVIAIVGSRISALSSYEKQLAVFKDNPWENGKFNPQVSCLASGDRIGLRTQIVWVLNETERGLKGKPEDEEPEEEIPITVLDVEDESVTVDFILPHSKVKQHAVLDKLLEKYANRSEKAKQSAGRLRLATRAGEMLVTCDLERKVGKHRQFFARGLAELLKI